MKKFLKNRVKEFFLLLTSVTLVCIPVFSFFYLFCTDSITWRFHTCLVILCIGFLASLKIHVIFSNRELDIIVNKILTIIVAFNFVLFVLANSCITFPIMFVLDRFSYTRKSAFRILRFFSVTSCFLLGVQVIEKGDKPKDQVIFAPNHRGSFDYILANLLPHFPLWQVIAGDNLIKFFPMSLFARISCIFIERENPLRNKFLNTVYVYLKSFFILMPLNKVLIKAGEFIKKGYSIVVFFEGTRKRPWVDSILVPKEKTLQGTFLMAIRNGIDIVPVAIYGSDIYKEPIKGHPEKKKWYELKWWISPTKITISYQPRVSVKDSKGNFKSRDTLMDEVRVSIETVLLQYETAS